MPAIITIKELKNMPIADLLREVKEQSALVAKLRLGIKMNKEKDTAKYCREKKQLARMMTVYTEKNRLSGLEKDRDTESGIRNPESRSSKSSITTRKS